MAQHEASPVRQDQVVERERADDVEAHHRCDDGFNSCGGRVGHTPSRSQMRSGVGLAQLIAQIKSSHSQLVGDASGAVVLGAEALRRLQQAARRRGRARR
jgi:hypothetical protein